MYNKKTIEDVEVKGKRVLVRCDFNVPLKDGKITSDKRIVAALPTIEYLLNHGAKVILCSHMGKPHAIFTEGFGLDKKEKKKIEELPEAEQAAAKAELLAKAKKNDPVKFTLKPVADRLNELLGGKVAFAKDIIGEDAKAKVAALKEGEAVLLENVRFDARETKNDPEFAKELASLAEVYVNDAFGTAHRAHASTAGVAAYLPAVCGYLIQKEISIMGKALSSPERPFVAILGGAKVSDKLNVINNLLDQGRHAHHRRRHGIHLSCSPGLRRRHLPAGQREDRLLQGYDEEGRRKGRQAPAARRHHDREGLPRSDRRTDRDEGRPLE